MESLPETKIELKFPKRPTRSKGFKGTEITLYSNHFNFTFVTDKVKNPVVNLYSFRIFDKDNIELAHDSRQELLAILGGIRQKIQEVYGKTAWHAGKNLWSFNLVKDDKIFETSAGGKEYAVAFKYAKELSLKPDFLKGNEEAAALRQYINILIKKFLKQSKYIEWGMNSKYYNPANKKSLLDKGIDLEVWTGFKTSCELFENCTLKILVDFSSRILRTQTVLDVILEIRNKNKNQTQAEFEEQVREEIQFRSAVTNYGNYRMWRITDIDFKKNPSATFELADKQSISIADYFKKTYNKTIKDMKQPLLINENLKNGRLCYLVPELMNMTGMTDEMRAQFKIMKELANYTKLEPNARMDEIGGIVKPMADYLKKEYNIEMKKENKITGYKLEPPTLTLGKSNIYADRGTYQLRDILFKPANFSKWMLVFPANMGKDAEEFVKTLNKASAAYGINVNEPAYVPVKDKSGAKMAEALKANFKQGTQIVVCFYPPIAKKHWYKALKDMCAKELGVPSQAVVSESLNKNTLAVASKILIQMSAKIGEEPWVMQKIDGVPEKTMIIGADVYHKLIDKNKSCVGFCASIDANFGKYYSKVTFQKPGEELMKHIGKLVVEAVKKYFANNKKFLPENIIFFRDGVAENQRRAILEFETRAIFKELAAAYPDYKPKLAEIVITKRIDDRFFTLNQSKGGFENPQAGTVVARDIVSNGNFDYFIVPQKVTQGTCTPTNYFCIYNDTDIAEDVFWRLSYSQCYNYFNWNGGIRVPAPVQYAHKLAYLVGDTIKDEVHKNLENSLFYL